MTRGAKYFGTLCAEGHDYHGTGCSERYVRGGQCVECMREWNSRRRDEACLARLTGSRVTK